MQNKSLVLVFKVLMHHECPRASSRQASGIEGVASTVMLGTWDTMNFVRSSDKEPTKCLLLGPTARVINLIRDLSKSCLIS